MKNLSNILSCLPCLLIAMRLAFGGVGRVRLRVVDRGGGGGSRGGGWRGRTWVFVTGHTSVEFWLVRRGHSVTTGRTVCSWDRGACSQTLKVVCVRDVCTSRVLRCVVGSTTRTKGRWPWVTVLGFRRADSQATNLTVSAVDHFYKLSTSGREVKIHSFVILKETFFFYIFIFIFYSKTYSWNSFQGIMSR